MTIESGWPPAQIAEDRVPPTSVWDRTTGRERCAGRMVLMSALAGWRESR